jgi:hypothetical protein
VRSRACSMGHCLDLGQPIASPQSDELLVAANEGANSCALAGQRRGDWIAAKTGPVCDPGVSWGRRPQTPGVYRLTAPGCSPGIRIASRGLASGRDAARGVSGWIAIADGAPLEDWHPAVTLADGCSCRGPAEHYPSAGAKSPRFFWRRVLETDRAATTEVVPARPKKWYRS